MAQEISRLGHWQWDVVADKVVWSDELYNIYRIEPDGEISYETYLEKLHPEDRSFVNHAVQKAFEEKQFPSFIHRILLSDGTEKIIQAKGDVVVNDKGEVVKMLGTAQDITESQKAQQQLEDRTRALESSNAELQRFAYVASHDLQEPLRKIMTFASLLDKELDGDVNENARLYMQKIVQSSGRMQRLIDDILAFSSLRVNDAAYRPTDLNAVLKQVLSDIEVRIESTGAVIRAEELPVIDAIPSQMEQLFQNLLSNALKFRKEEVPPIIHISGKVVTTSELPPNVASVGMPNAATDLSYHQGRELFVRLEIRDNGIGFESSYSDKIFEIFQRLHSSKSFEGTGVGLAICKKIVDNHHGVISASSRPGEGAVFVFYLPLSQKSFSFA